MKVIQNHSKIKFSFCIEPCSIEILYLESFSSKRKDLSHFKDIYNPLYCWRIAQALLAAVLHHLVRGGRNPPQEARREGVKKERLLRLQATIAGGKEQYKVD